MANDSSTGGFLTPESAPPSDDAALCALLQPTIVGITGLSGALVRRRGQQVPGPQPDRDATWCSFMVSVTSADTNPSIVHDGTGDGGLGVDLHIRGEELQVSTSFYGPAACGAASLLRDGLGVSQNREAMRAQGLSYVGIDRITFVPDLENGQFLRRADLIFTVRRMAVRTFPVRNILTPAGGIVADSGGPAGPSVVQASLSAPPLTSS